MAVNRYTSYADKSSVEIRSEALNIAERAAIGSREIRSLVRMVAELATRIAELEGHGTKDAVAQSAPPLVDRALLASL